ncbi:histidine--tRNA ligase [Parafrigoribacterium mesophilum]|uniref:histidine--tRNA ligase n=1 Tax=Parafrigoribacterium mesophilum TaxID=433646 RepID=UPI0031FC953D
MATSVNPPRGMRDFLPDEKARREAALTVIRGTYRAHGFDEIETPVMEDSSRLHAGLGGDNEKLAFGVLRRGLDTADLHAATEPLDLVDLGLRFDLTVPLARFYATHHAELPTVFRAIQLAPVWRAERPQKGRYRQFLQCDIDIIGEAGPLAEIELLTATAATVRALGLTEWHIRLNDRRILHSLLDWWGIDADFRDRALITLDKEDKIGADAVAAELAEFVTIDVKEVASTLKELAALSDGGWSLQDAPPPWLDLTAYDQLMQIRSALPEVPLVFSPNLVRGMGYYTGAIFEIAHPSSSSSLGGGGRYDGMIGRFLGRDVPATGFSIGFERILDLVNLTDDDAEDACALLYDDTVAPAQLIALKTGLVAGGRRVRLERLRKNAGALFAELTASGYHRVATVSASTVTVEDLEFRNLK